MVNILIISHSFKITECTKELAAVEASLSKSLEEVMLTIKKNR